MAKRHDDLRAYAKSPDEDYDQQIGHHTPNYDKNARAYILELKACAKSGEKPGPMPDAGMRWDQCCRILTMHVESGPEHFELVIQSIQLSFPGLKELLAGHPDENAREYILSMIAGKKPARMPDVGKWLQPCQILAANFDNNPDNFDLLVKDMYGSIPGLKQLMENDPLQGDAPAEDDIAVPPLPPEVKANEKGAEMASPTLDAMIKLLQKWCTRSYEGYHEAVALFVLDAIAARRPYLPWRAGMWTSLYFMLVADSTTHAKTEAASYGRRIIEDCGLGFLLAPDEITPQKLMSNMTGENVPRNYSLKDPEGKEYIRLKLAFSGQKSWIYDEFGNKLQEIIAAKGHNAYFYALLKQLYDNKRTYEYDTLTRDNEHIDMPYLSIIGTATPACLKPIASKQSAVWTDGMFARIAFIVPPKDELKLQSAPREEFYLPDDIRKKLIAWHQELGTPDCKIIDTQEKEDLLNQALGEDKKKKKENKPPFEVERGALPQQIVTWNDDVYKAHEAYYQALATLARDHHLDERFKATYGRLPDMALKNAMLVASLENNGVIEMRHWARGQQTAEHWRANYHELIAQLSSDETGYGQIENEVLDAIAKLGQMANSRVISQQGRHLRKIGAPKVREVCVELAAAGVIEQGGKGINATFGPKGQAK